MHSTPLKPDTDQKAGRPILTAQNIGKTFPTPEGTGARVLDGIDLQLHDGEIVALLGRSGSGKSTLLRILLGLLEPTDGTVTYRGQQVTDPMSGMAMIFQSFALFPWLTVQQNVELGLRAEGMRSAEAERRALEAIDLVGLDGFETAFPKELSGGMRQRVGFARALVTNPDVLFMDEPFSSLDVLTSENLRSDLLDLWQSNAISTRVILIVTHNIEDAILMADRVLILEANPGRLSADIPVPLDRPRDRTDPAFTDLVEQVYQGLTTPADAPEAVEEAIDQNSIGYRLPNASIAAVSGLVERVAREDYGRDDLPDLADEMRLEIDDLFPVLDAAVLFGFAQVGKGDIVLLREGHTFADAGILKRKELLASILAERVALVGHITQVLRTRQDHRAPDDRFLRELEDDMSAADAADILATAIDWGRYAELFEYDGNAGVFFLPDTDDAS